MLLACTSLLGGAEPALNIAPNPGFEAAPQEWLGWYCVGVQPDGDRYGIGVTTDTAHSGSHSLRISPGPATPVAGTVWFPSHNGDEGQRPSSEPGAVRGARTFALRLDGEATTAAASAWIRKPADATLHVALIWTARKNREAAVEIQRDDSDVPSHSDGEWALYALTGERPRQADRVQFVIETGAVEPVYVDDVQLSERLTPRLELLVDQVGYEAASQTKTVILQSTVALAEAPAARLVDTETGRTVQQLDWRGCGYLAAWERYHWSADFSHVRMPGRYCVQLTHDGLSIQSPEFCIDDDLLVGQTARLGYRFYYFQRCGCEVPGFHAACHLDDAVLADGTMRDLVGGWHDAGDYNKYNGLTPEAVYSLAYAWRRRPELFSRWDCDENSRPDILDEATWGAVFLRKMLDKDRLALLNAVDTGYRYWGPPELETDNLANTGDERGVRPGEGDATHLISGFALLGQALAARDIVTRGNQPPAAGDVVLGEELITLAERMFEKSGGGIQQAAALHAATGRAIYRERARQRAAQLIDQSGTGAVAGFRELAEYALAFPDDPAVPRIRQLADKRVAELAAQCDPRFGVVCDGDAAAGFVYFRPYSHVNDWYVGDTSVRLDAAIDALYAAKLGATEGKSIAERQIHWVLGCNPCGVSCMEGVGSRFVPAYHHRYNAIAGNPRAPCQALINGIVRPWPLVDRPWLDGNSEPNADYHCNEPWLLHNNRWMQVIALW
ncbi:MAG: glycoside hydrolase family 9 protein [Pirellulales bacterium]